MAKEYREQVGVRVEEADDLLNSLEWTADTVWLSRSCCTRRATLRGIPARRVDVCVDTRLTDDEDFDARDRIVALAGTKLGRFDGAERTRITIRILHGRDAEKFPAGRIDVDRPEGDIRISLTSLSGVLWEGRWTPLRSDLDDYEPGRVVMWHWTRYYRHLDYEDARAEADAFRFSRGWTLAEANRAASRALYRLSRELGWRKLTLRERRRLGLDGGQWVREEVYAAAQERIATLGHPTGASEASLRAAAGGTY